MSTPTRSGPPIDLRPPYELLHEHAPDAWAVRENLHDIVNRELLGPAGGDTELLNGSPDSVYLVGRIAPAKLGDGKESPIDAESNEELTDVGDDKDAELSRGVPQAAVDDSSAEADEDDVHDDPPKRGLMIPASMGLRFQVTPQTETFTVRATWGVYDPRRAEGEEGAGKHTRYQRTPHSYSKTLTIADLVPGQTTEETLHDQVLLKVDCYPDTVPGHEGRRIVEVALCNDKVVPRRIPTNAWLYQTQLHVESADGAVFVPIRDELLDDNSDEEDTELRHLNLQYRDRLEFAVGRTCSVDWHQVEGSRRADRVWTTWLPTAETPQTAAREIASATLDMTKLATATPAELKAGLSPIVTGYSTWLDEQQDRIAGLPAHWHDDASDLVSEARRVHRQLAAGLDFLLADSEALRCFQFMNAVMAQQRIHSQIAQERADSLEMGIDEARTKVLSKGSGAHSWRTFQLAFILMQIAALTEPENPYRSGDLAHAELLFFPTGGGKTEAYLGLAAFTFAIRRRQGVVQTSDGPLNGNAGVAVLMRYTLRLLTSQQFQRATALVCAAELARREDIATWGTEPFRIGLWVGTDVTPKRYAEAAAELKKVNEGRGYRLTVLQVQRCPWCGTKIAAGQVEADELKRRVYVYCGNQFGECPFAEGGSAKPHDEGLPILTVDEEIYRLAPAFVIATVDKFARLAREGEAAALFGFVTRRCDLHGYVHADSQYCKLQDGSKHPAKMGSAATHPVGRLRPPDLIIQDELHLISGALGTTVGLFEVAIDLISSWRTAAGQPVKPLIVASSATVRNAHDQVRALYGRDVTIFPPQVLDAGNTFFSEEQKITQQAPGRRYLGVSTTGVRLTTAEIRVSEILLAGGQLMLDRHGNVADPYLTMVGYFSTTRELAGMARYMGDDIRTALRKGRAWHTLPRRYGTGFGDLNVGELTSRVSSADITARLDEMAIRFDSAIDSTAAGDQRQAGHATPARKTQPFDAVLATSMLQVGVDVTRLGLMLVVGQPKNTAEYIQASSRVGRDVGSSGRAARPGLVLALGNWARPRDLAHFEQFRHYHETFYAQVEALSVTPFSPTSMDRGLDGVLVSAARVLQASRTDGLSPERAAGRINGEKTVLLEYVDVMVERIRRASDDPTAERARQRLLNRVDQWQARRDDVRAEHLQLAYERTPEGSGFKALLISAEHKQAACDSRDTAPFVVANSMREVQPEINLLVSPIPTRLYNREPPGAPQWQPPKSKD